MFKNYFKTAWRNLAKNPLLSLINLGGLAIGIAAIVLIGIYIYSETGYDNFHQNKSSLYRVGFRFWQNGKILGDDETFTPPFGVDAKNEFSEIRSFARISSERVAYMSCNDKTLKVEDIHHADSNFFQLFSYKLLQGDPLTALKNPYSIVLTKETAKKLFGSQEAIGKVVRLDNQTDYIVAGIGESPPANSHLSYNALLSFITLYNEPGNFMDWNGGEQYITYLQLNEGVNKASLEKQFPAFMWKHINQQYSKSGFKIDASLQPVTDIHLYYSRNSSALRTNIYIFSVVALLIILISCINYINLTTAQATARFKEVGVRKVLGAERGQLIKQFLVETILLTTIAFIISLALVMLLAPAYERMLGKSLPSVNAETTPVLLLLFVIATAVGAIAGSYVAFYLSSFKVTRIFKSLLPKTTQSVFRKGLIITQFVISIGLLSCTLLVTLQLKFSKNKNPGFDHEHILVLPMIGAETQESYPLLQQQLSQLTDVSHVSALSEIPYTGINNNGFVPEGQTTAMVIHQLDADENFLKTFNIPMTAGDYFSKDRPAISDGYIINETLAKTLGWKNAIGKTISRNGDHKVVGIVKDFHFASLHDKIEPLIITNKPWQNHYQYLVVKYQTANTSAFIDQVRQTWKKALSNAPFDYSFLDDTYNSVYKSEERFRQIFFYFSALSIILSLAGVFALVALTLKQRTKELGIRKVLGANLVDIVKLTVKDFIGLIFIAALIATPLAWYYMNKWLQNFAYRISISWWIFAVCGLVVLVISVLTISFQAIKAAIANPVKTLRTE